LETLFLPATQENIAQAAQIIRKGGLVGMPTETVYGLAADALNGAAVARIFTAKGRPQDNPLIVHIASLDTLPLLVSAVPEAALRLAKAFWPGPLTMVLPKSPRIPDETSAGLPTVAVRFPSHPVAQALIRTAGPLAAPSANLSGAPSTTTAEHVYRDLNGKIEAVLDGGPCEVGVESTVLTLAQDPPCLLRPGGVTLEQLQTVLGNVAVHHAVLHQLQGGEPAVSPGMKYRHYSPQAHVVLLKGSREAYLRYVNHRASQPGVAALCYDEDIAALHVPCISLGREDDDAAHARVLFHALRKLDDLKYQIVYAHCPDSKGIGMAVYNRLIRAAGFEVFSID
jgi:L-threonylcarbamoyladenylate synthase